MLQQVKIPHVMANMLNRYEELTKVMPKSLSGKRSKMIDAIHKAAPKFSRETATEWFSKAVKEKAISIKKGEYRFTGKPSYDEMKWR